jgi:hypothetical protein
MMIVWLNKEIKKELEECLKKNKSIKIYLNRNKKK